MANQFGSNTTGENVSGDGNAYGESIVGVQLDAPMSSGFEDGFDVPGTDMSSLAPRATDHLGVEMQGTSVGVDQADIMVGMASVDGFPTFTTFGAESDQNMGRANPGASETASSAGFHLISSFDQMYGSVPGREQPGGTSAPGPAMQGLLAGAISNQGYPNAGAPGIDSMQGLDMAGFPAPLGEQDTDSTDGGYS